MIKESARDRLFSGIITIILVILAIIAMIPLLSEIAISLSSKAASDMNRINLLPVEFTLDSWKYILTKGKIWPAFFITLSAALMGTLLALAITSLMAYPLSKPRFKAGKFLMLYVVFTMIFKAPTVPYFLTLKGMGLYNSYWVLVFPHILTAYNLIIMRTFFRQFPEEIEEAAVIDGCGHFRLLARIVLPSSKAVLATLKTTASVRAASDAVLLQFERPADQSEAVKAKRAGYGQKYFDKYAKKGSVSSMGFSNSPLATVRMISPNRTPNRNHAIDTITIHCFVGQVTAKRGCEVFQPSSKQASCNYVVGYDGSIGLCVEEKDRSWCTGGYKKVNGVKVPIRVNGISGSSNDYQAVTIEVASDATHPYAITEKAMAALIELCADICRRNGIKKLLWKGDKNLVGKVDQQNLTVHRWFANKACPGDYIYQRLGDIATKVNVKLGASATSPAPAAPVSKVPYKVRITATDLRIRQGPNTDATIVQKAIAPGVYTIVSEATGQGATLWGKLKSGKGWVSLDFCKKI